MDNLKDHIEKYIKGELSPAEMRALEMKALHDPFLADALEGAESISPNEFSEDVKSINKKIKTKSKNIYLWPLRIAASILLIAIVYYTVIQTDNDFKPEQLALQKNEAIEQPVFSGNDSIESEIKPSDVEKTEKQKENITPVPEKPKLAARTETVKPSKLIVAESIAQADDKEAKKDLSIAGKETDELVIIAEAENASTIRSEESKSEPIRAKMKELKKSATQPQTLSGAGARQADSKSIAAVEDNNVLANEAYQKYLKDNVKYPKDAIVNKVEGTVTISFNVGTDGSPSDFKVEQGIGYGCNEELIRLIKEGPVWNALQSNKRATASFKFEIQP